MYSFTSFISFFNFFEGCEFMASSISNFLIWHSFGIYEIIKAGEDVPALTISLKPKEMESGPILTQELLGVHIVWFCYIC